MNTQKNKHLLTRCFTTNVNLSHFRIYILWIHITSYYSSVLVRQRIIDLRAWEMSHNEIGWKLNR